MGLEWLIAGSGRKAFRWYLSGDHLPKNLENDLGVLDCFDDLNNIVGNRIIKAGKDSLLSSIRTSKKGRRLCPLHKLQFLAKTVLLYIGPWKSGRCDLINAKKKSDASSSLRNGVSSAPKVS